MTYETLTTHRHGDAVEVITLNRPDAANGLSPLMARELADAAARCDHDASVKAVVLTATGKFFSAGGDVKAMAGSGDEPAPGIKSLADDLHRAVSTLARMAAPLVVAVNGVHAAVRRLLLETYTNALETQMELEGRTIAACAATPNGREGIAAFVEKRRPNYA